MGRQLAEEVARRLSQLPFASRTAKNRTATAAAIATVNASRRRGGEQYTTKRAAGSGGFDKNGSRIEHCSCAIGAIAAVIQR